MVFIKRFFSLLISSLVVFVALSRPPAFLAGGCRVMRFCLRFFCLCGLSFRAFVRLPLGAIGAVRSVAFFFCRRGAPLYNCAVALLRKASHFAAVNCSFYFAGVGFRSVFPFPFSPRAPLFPFPFWFGGGCGPRRPLPCPAVCGGRSY